LGSTLISGHFQILFTFKTPLPRVLLEGAKKGLVTFHTGCKKLSKGKGKRGGLGKKLFPKFHPEVLGFKFPLIFWLIPKGVSRGRKII